MKNVKIDYEYLGLSKERPKEYHQSIGPQHGVCRAHNFLMDNCVVNEPGVTFIFYQFNLIR